MPLENIPNSESTTTESSVVSPEIISFNTRYILGAKLQQADFEYIAVSNDARFAELQEGAFFTDLSSEGLNRVGRKLNGQRVYLVYESEMRAYVTAEVNTLKPSVVDPAEDTDFPVATVERPVYEGKTYVFLSAGTFLGQAVEAGSTAVAKSDIAVGQRPTWADLVYNGASNTIEITPIVPLQSVRLDGSAVTDKLVSEKGIADAINAFKVEINSSIALLDTTLRGLITSLSNQVAANTQAIANLALELAALPKILSESLDIGDGINQLFEIPLVNKYLKTPAIYSFYRVGSALTRMQYGCDAQVKANSDGTQSLVVAFSGVPSVNQFKIEVQGEVVVA